MSAKKVDLPAVHDTSEMHWLTITPLMAAKIDAFYREVIGPRLGSKGRWKP